MRTENLRPLAIFLPILFMSACYSTGSDRLQINRLRNKVAEGQASVNKSENEARQARQANQDLRRVVAEMAAHNSDIPRLKADTWGRE